MQRTSKIITAILSILAVVFVFSIFSGPISSADFWWHLRSGQTIVETRELPASDPFSHTTYRDPADEATQRNTLFTLRQAWLGQAIMYGVFRAFSFDGIIYLRAALLTLVTILLYRLARGEGMGIHSALLTTLPAVVILSGFTAERPQLFSFLFFALMVFLIEGFRRASLEDSALSRRAVATGSAPDSRDTAICALLRDSRTRSQRHDAISPGDDGTGIIASSTTRSHANREIATLTPAARNDGKKTFIYLVPIPFIMLLWANVHGGFFLGIVLLGAYSLCESIKYAAKRFGMTLSRQSLVLLLTTAIVSSLASFLNPNGFTVFRILAERKHGIYRYLVSETISSVEHARMGLFGPELIAFLALLVICAALLLFRIRRLDLTDAGTLLLFAGLGIYLFRLIPFFVPFAVLFPARYGVRRTELPFGRSNDARSYPSPAPDRMRNGERTAAWRHKSRGATEQMIVPSLVSLVLIFALLKGSLFGGVVSTHLFHRREVVVPHKYPERAVAFLKEARPRATLFNPLDWGGYLMWSLYPEYRVFIDGRGLREDVVVRSAAIMAAVGDERTGVPEWKSYLDHYGVTMVLTYSVEHFTGRLLPLVSALVNDPEWYPIFADDISLIFLRDTPDTRPAVERFSVPRELVWKEVVSEARSKSRGFFSKSVRAQFFVTTGDAYLVLGDYRAAMDAFRQAWRLAPENPTVRKRIQFLDSIHP